MAEALHTTRRNLLRAIPAAAAAAAIPSLALPSPATVDEIARYHLAQLHRALGSSIERWSFVMKPVDGSAPVAIINDDVG